MKTTPTQAPAGWTFPEDWTESARELFAEVIAERPDLGGAELGALEHACYLTSAAERLDEIARAAGMVSTGSTGQTIVHPAVVESRLQRANAATILARLTPTRRERFAARAGRGAAAKNASSGTRSTRAELRVRLAEGSTRERLEPAPF